MSDYKTWEQREADAALTKAHAEQARVAAEAAKVDLAGNAAGTKTRQMREQLAQVKLQQQMAEQLDAGADRADDRKRLRAERRADSGVTFKAMVKTFVAVCMTAALPAQFSYFLGLHKPGQSGPAWLMGPLPIVLELAAWVSVAGTAWARRKGLPLWPFWALTGFLAGFAAWINLQHGTAQYGPVAGWSLAAASFAGPLMWELSEWLESRAAVDFRSREQRAADKVAAASRRKAEQEQAGHRKARKAKFPTVWIRYEEILAAHPLGTISSDSAWMAAWTDVHRAPLGVTADTYRGRVDADAALDEVLAQGRDRTVYRELDAFLFDLFPDDGDSGTGSVAAAPDKPSGGPSQARNLLGRKGKQASGGSSQKTPRRPLDPEHVERVEKLAQALGSRDKLSARNVGEAIGGGSTEYVIRLRDAVKNADSGEEYGAR